MKENAKAEAVVIGASAGAVDALSEILPKIPSGYSLPIFIVVHLPPHNESVLSELFGPRCRIPVKEAEDKENIRPGVAYFAPPNYHLLVEEDGTLSLSSDEPELFSRPSINVLFESAADAYGPGLVGVILTGASSDGANGIRLIADRGGRVLAQDPNSATARTMPESALQAARQVKSMTLGEIGAFLARLPEIHNF